MLISDWISDVCSSDLGIFILTSTWVQGRKLLFDRIHRDSPPLDEFVERTGPSLERVPGTAVFMTGNSEVVPHALLHNLKHNKVLHQRVVVMTVVTEDTPRVPYEQRVEIEQLGKGFYRITARFGFIARPHVPREIGRAACGERGGKLG